LHVRAAVVVCTYGGLCNVGQKLNLRVFPVMLERLCRVSSAMATKFQA